ncbi:MAG: hypothetical protein ABI278_05680 [Candidatus Aquilonibacter sp.]
MTLFYYVPWWLVTAVVTLICVAVACGGHILVRRAFPRTNFIEHNEVAGFIVAVVGVLYAVLLGFLTVVVWEHFSAAEDQTVQEVDAATDIARFADQIDAIDRLRVVSDLKSYTGAVIHDEWPKMQNGESSAKAQLYVTRLFADASEMRVKSLRDANLQNHLLDRVQTMADLRRRRITSDQSAMPPVVWASLIAGGAALMGFIYLFGLKNFKAQLLMTAATATMIGLCFSIVISLDYPYRGDISISPERWIALDRELTAGGLDAGSKRVPREKMRGFQ